MNYKNGRDILPSDLLKELQKYADGELVYIPKVESKRAGWGENNGTRLIMEMRNSEIYSFYKNGTPIDELVQRFHLSDDSIRKIVSRKNKAVNI